MQEYTRKKNKESEKLHTSIKGRLKCSYIKKNVLSLEVNTALI